VGRSRAGAGAAAGAVVALVLLAPLASGDPAPSQHDPAAVRERADEILAGEEFQPPEDSILDNILEWIGDHLPGDSDGGGSEGGGSSGGGGLGAGSSVGTVVALVLIVVALGFLVRSLLGHRLPERGPRTDPVAIDVEERRTATEWAAAAERHEAAGDWKEGLRCRFRALVERLIDERAVPEVPGRTSGELRGDVRASLPTASEPFSDAAFLFERAWYGDVDTGPDEARRFAALAEQVLAASAATVGAAP
jgi:hypothetical protein